MKITLFGATGDLGQELLEQALAAGHDVTVLVRNPEKLSAGQREHLTLVQGDGLVAEDVRRALPEDTAAVLFAVGVDEKTSPPDLCTDVTRHILATMRDRGLKRFIWCGGGSNLRPEDEITLGARFVRWFSERFLNHRHTDKEHQLDLLDEATDIDWFGIRPLQMNAGPRREQYRLGFNRFSGLSKITFADCAHAMLGMLEDDTWRHKAPIVQY
ncbi:MAG: NAD(P)H-binding protein [Halioglobus sp.]|nr:NAD(P)H-binding protein [Halioglobus sp.]